MAVLHRRAAVLASVGLSILVSGCGGDGTGIAVTPTPPAAQTVANAPAPPATPVNASFAAPLKSETFNNLSARMTGTETPTGAKNATAMLEGTGSKITFDATTNTYQFTSVGSTPNGTTPEQMNLVTTGTDYCYTTPCTVSGSANGSISRRGVQGANSLGFQYTYVSFANWHNEVASGSDTARTMNVAVFGATTAANAIPTTGTASYQLDITGYQITGPLGTSGSHAIGSTYVGTGTANFDFAGGAYTMTGTVPGVVNYGASEAFSSSGKLTSGANGYAGTFNFNDSGAFTGTLNGWFFGPAAQEVGAVFAGGAPDGRATVGTIVGHK
jgi:hypothetical protein